MKNDFSEYLYHYCSAEALLGILGNKEFWISKLGFMNDASEGNYCHELGHSYLIEKIKNTQTQERDKLREIATAIRRILWSQNSYILSFSEDGDSLSQWRAYAPNGGYSLGIHRDNIESFCEKSEDNEFVECTYEETEHQRLISSSIDETLDKHDWTDGMKGASDAVSEIRDSLREFSVRFKHNSFAEELEHRVVASVAYKKMDMRAQQHSRLVPFTKLDATKMLCPLLKTHPIHIRFSPGMKTHPVGNELYWWLLTKGYYAPVIDESVSPYSI